MKRIIVPVNFSEVSLDALEFALDVANAMNYSLRLLSVIDTGSSIFFWRPSKTRDEEEVKAKMEDFIAQNQERYTVEGGVLDYQIVSGSTVKTLIKTVASPDSETYAVVLGINTETETNSETFSLITDMTVPVITWRKGFEHKPATSILMPIGTKNSSRQKVPFVTGFARRIGAKIHVLGCADTEDLPSIKTRITLHVEQTIDFIRQNEVECEAHFKFGADVGRTIVEYSNTLKTDAIATMTDVAEDTVNMFTASNAEYILKHAKQPVICVRPSR